MEINVNNNLEIIKTIKDITNEKLLSMCEKDTEFAGVVKSFIQAGFITTSSSVGHIYDKWKDPIYIAVYVDAVNISKVLHLIETLNTSLTIDDKDVVYYTFNYNSVLENNAYNIEYMFGVQVNVFENGEQRRRILSALKKAVEGMKNVNEFKLDYKFIYLVGRFISFSKADTNWINISFNASTYDNNFSFIFKKHFGDKGVIEREYDFKNGLQEFEYLMNY